ncbi:mitochondrial import inner membrane translocase subunit Tim10 B-like [Scleropages formosus]|uniref:Mitochondrial import inner membrane translocase subunit Tim10 B-like n=1 Tax=Scleropages formosus TaxID=113540 RepID=A0A0P7X155_SCLFO|nr:mitochondrial import inner membrane translocase subunit Tim10 B-like [Scleropages formosus]
MICCFLVQLRDFLLVYNRMTEICFQRCTSNMNYRNLTMDEEKCVDSCAGKLIRSNHRLMGTYVQLMPRIVQKRMEEMESKAAEAAKPGLAPDSQQPTAGTGGGPEAPPVAAAESSAWGLASAATHPSTATEMAPVMSNMKKTLPSLVEDPASVQPQAIPPIPPSSSGTLPAAASEPSIYVGQQPRPTS